MKPISYKVFSSILLLVVIIAVVLSCQEDDFVPLKIYSINPTVALIGDTITLSGEGFSPDYQSNNVFFSSVKKYVHPIKGSNTKKLLVVVPDSAETGSIHVNILDEETFDSSPLTVKPPVFESITPNRGYVGDTIIIKGENFRSDRNNNHVKFTTYGKTTGIEALVISSTSTELHIIVPEGAIPGNISVLGFRGPKFNFKNFIINSISPDHGVVGDTISVLGLGFIPDGTTTVFFNQGVDAYSLLDIITSREFKVIVPAGARNGKIRMTNSGSGKEVTALSETIFQVYPSITGLSSTSGPPDYLLTIMGHSFMPKATGNIVSVTINGMVAPVQSSTESSIVVKVPVGGTSGAVVVTVNDRVAQGPNFQVTAAGTPLIERIFPAIEVVGEEVTITGYNFSATAANNIVKFADNITATIKSASTNTLMVTVPAGAVTGLVNVTSNGVAAPSGFLFTVKTQVTDFTISEVTSHPVLQLDMITINGNNFSTAGNISVYITQDFGSRVSYKLITNPSDITSTEIKSQVEEYFDPQTSTRVIFPPGDYKVSIRYTAEPLEDVSNTKPLTIKWDKPIINSLSTREGLPGSNVILTGPNFYPIESFNTVNFKKAGVPPVKASPVQPVDADANTVAVVVPNDVDPGIYQITVTTGGTESDPETFTVTSEGEVTVPVKPVYYLGLADDGKVVLNKITKTPTTPLISTIYKAPEGMTSMVVDLTSSKVYFSEKSNDNPLNDGIFSINLNNVSVKKKIVNTPAPNGTTITSYGEFVNDLSLDVVNKKLFWAYAPGNVQIVSANTDDNSIGDLNEPLAVLNSEFSYASGLTYNENKLYVLAAFDDDAFNTNSNLLSIDVNSPSSTPATLIDEDDGLGIIFDTKIDPDDDMIYILSKTIDEQFTISKANLDGTDITSTDITTLIDFEVGTEVLGMSLDLKDKYIYWLQVKGGNSSIVVARMNGDNIPGKDVKTETVYNALSFRGRVQYEPISIAVDDGLNGSGANQRAGSRSMSSSMNMQLKYRKPKSK